MKKQILAAILLIAILFSVVPLPVTAAVPTNDETAVALPAGNATEEPAEEQREEVRPEAEQTAGERILLDDLPDAVLETEEPEVPSVIDEPDDEPVNEPEEYPQPVRALAQRHIPAELTQEEAAQQALQSWDASAAADGSVMVYLVSSEDGNQTLYLFGSGAMQDYTKNARPAWVSDTTKKEVLSIYVAPEVTRIGNYAFASLTAVTDVILSEGLTEIGSFALSELFGVSDITVPASLTVIGSGAFYWCRAMQSVRFAEPSSLTTVDGSAFNSCYALSAIALPESVKTINAEAFYRCSALTEFTFPSSVTTLGERIFGFCVKLKRVVYPGGMTYIPRRFFYGCTALEEFVVTEPSAITSIGAHTFCDCTALKECVIPDGVTTIGDSIFERCSSLQRVTLPDSIIKVGNSAFASCTSLESVVYPGQATSIPQKCFDGCVALRDFSYSSPSKVTQIGFRAFYQCGALERFDFPAGLETIGPHAFRECTSLKFSTIPDSVKTIEDYAFLFCDSLGEVTIPPTTAVGFRSFTTRNLNQLNYKWDGRYEIENSYVHEDFAEYYQGSASWCVRCCAGTLINALWHLQDDDTEALSEEFERILAEHDASEYGKRQQGVEIYLDAKGVKYTSVNFYPDGVVLDNYPNYEQEEQFLQDVIPALQKGAVVYYSFIISRHKLDGTVEYAGHTYTIYGIDKDGYFYISEPAVDGLETGKYDIDFILRQGLLIHGYVIAMPENTTDMDTEQIVPKNFLPEVPETNEFVPPVGARVGIYNETTDTKLYKSARWVNEEKTLAEVELNFSYTINNGTDYVYVLDYSDSMTGSTLQTGVSDLSVEKTLTYRAISDLLSNTALKSRAAVVTFSDSEERTMSGFTTDGTVIRDALLGGATQGRTGYSYGLGAAYDLLVSRTGEDAKRPAVVIFVTDGKSDMWVGGQDGSGVYGGSERDALRELGVAVHYVCLNGNMTDAIAVNMKEISGGTYSDASTCAKYTDVLNQAVLDAQFLKQWELTDVIGTDFELVGGLDGYLKSCTYEGGEEGAYSLCNQSVYETKDGRVVLGFGETYPTPNVTYTVKIQLQLRRNASGLYPTGVLPTNYGNAKLDATEENEVATPLLERDRLVQALSAQAHIIYKYSDLNRAGNQGLYTDGIRFNMEVKRTDLQAALEPGDRFTLATLMTPLDKLQKGDTTNYLLLNIGQDGKVLSNGSFTFLKNASVVKKSKNLSGNMIIWTEEMDTCADAATLARLLKEAGLSVFEVTEDGFVYTVYTMFSKSARQAQADREIAYRGAMVLYREETGYTVTYSYQRNNSATRIFNHTNCERFGVINVSGASEEDMLQGFSTYTPSLEVQKMEN